MTSRRHPTYCNFKGKTKGYVTKCCTYKSLCWGNFHKRHFHLLVQIVKGHVNYQLPHDIIFFTKALASHLIWVKKLFTYGTLVVNLRKFPQTKWMIRVFVISHNNLLLMESPQAKPIRLDNKNGSAIINNMGIGMNYGFWPKRITIHFLHAFKPHLNFFFFIF